MQGDDERVIVPLVVNLATNGMMTGDILAEYPDLGLEDIQWMLPYSKGPLAISSRRGE